ncbi:phage head morphogenesis protein [Mergibacter septicus]|uniref:Phage head morphogenesis protein n=1 Tax=Mergibacter septicus TaxID=221402 RepID=A0A8E3S9S4_9PAST|nr:phage minor head protein [Mergibacter septicus]AWX15225.1 phage head morphogenesis protein [Mergibacter septicus]QDJ14479.1 phage head morphogenesis protein [Mergibacter septicus]UTU48084.1 phage head morphogenesis protein [Mergibacter septicus]WMR96304.1 phage minor head protein [Mergibacter septicus]
MAIENGFTFKEQVRYFEKKLNLPTDSYLDVLGEEHDYFFMVAGANRNELVNAFRQAVDEAITNGETLQSFRKRFDKIVDKTGWQYKGGRNWRTRIIYDTNVYGAYNRGRLKQHLDLADVMPYWEYIHNDNSHPRPHHVKLHGTIRPANDPFWRYYYPIKAYGCHCTVIAHDKDDLVEMDKHVSPPVEIEFEDKLVGVRSGNPRTINLPKGYDAGFSPHNFDNLTASRNQSVDAVLMQKLSQSEPRFASRLINDVIRQRPQAIAMLNTAMTEMVESVAKEKLARGQMKYVGVLHDDVLTKLDGLDKAPQSAVIAVRDQDVLHALRESKQAKGINLPIEFWKQLPEKLRNPKAILLESQQKQPTLVFVYDTEQGKVAIKMDYEIQKQDPLTQKKQRVKVNMVRTASTIKSDVEWNDFKKSYDLLWGNLD